MSKIAFVTATLAIALGSAATALAGPGGHGVSGGGMSLGGGNSRGLALGAGGGIGSGAGAMSMAHGPVGGPGPGAMNGPLGTGPGHPMTFNRAGPMTNGPTFNRAPMNGPIGRTGPNWANNNWHHGDLDHHHHHHGNAFFAFGFDGGPYYDYAYNSCWAQVPTYYGWQWVYVCGDYGYY